MSAVRVVSGALVTIATVLLGLSAVPAGSAPAPPVKDQGVTVATVPKVVGVTVELDGARAVTGEDGVARFAVANRPGAGTRLHVVSREVTNQATGNRSTFERIYGTGPDIVLAFGTEKQVDFTFKTTGDRQAVPSHRIHSMTIRSSVGDRIDDVPLGRPVWLRSTRVVSSQNGPLVRPILWSVDKVDVDGSNVVNRAQLRFEPRLRTHVVVPLLFFTARVHVSDAFYGFDHGGRLDVTRPNGTSFARPISPDGDVVLRNFPRGDYKLTVVGAGLHIVRPVSLSRDQDLDLELMSWVDVGTVILIGVVLVGLPLIIGLRRRRHGRSELIVDGQGPSTSAEPVQREEQARAEESGIDADGADHGPAESQASADVSASNAPSTADRVS